MKIGKNVKIWHEEKSVFGDCTIDDNCIIHAPVWIGNNVEIGKKCKIQAFAFLPPGVRIGNNVFVGPHVCFTNDRHPPSGRWTETIVGSNAKIGAGAVILPGAHIRRNAVIGAGAVVTKEVPKNTTIAGNPARELTGPRQQHNRIAKRFGVIGLGFIFNKHAEAIESNGGKILIGCDIDVLKRDKLPKGASFTTNWHKIRNVDFVSILTPNHLHKNMTEFFARQGIAVLIEKPPVISSRDLRELSEYNNVYTVLQLRHHPELLKWKKQIDQHKKYIVEMRVMVQRDEWYFKSWKADERQSGGILFNIGIHYFDTLTYLFGDPVLVKTTELSQKQASGLIGFQNTIVNWKLSLKAPMDNQQRVLKINGERLDLGKKFEGLHARVYEEFLEGRGVPIQACEKTIKLIESIKRR